MSLPKMTTAVDNISKLDTRPNAVNGLTADELKAKFDKAPEDIKRFLNEVLIPALDGAITLDALGAVPETRKVNGQALSADVTVSAEDVPAFGPDQLKKTTQYLLDELADGVSKAVPKTRRVAGKTLDADVTLDAASIDYAGAISGAANVKAALDALNAKKDVAVFSATLLGETLSSAATFPQISAAYSAGKQVLLKVDTSGGIYWLLPLVRFLGGMVASFAAWVSNSRLAVATLSYSAASTPPVNAWSLTQVPLSAESVAYSGKVGSDTVANVKAALDALAIGKPLDMTADYVASGAENPLGWATMAKVVNGVASTTEYRVEQGQYVVREEENSLLYYVTIYPSALSGNDRMVSYIQIEEGYDFQFYVYHVGTPGETERLLLNIGSDGSFTIKDGEDTAFPPATFVISLVRNADGTFTADETMLRIRAAYRSGDSIWCEYTDKLNDVGPVMMPVNRTHLVSTGLAPSDEDWIEFATTEIQFGDGDEELSFYRVKAAYYNSTTTWEDYSSRKMPRLPEREASNAGKFLTADSRGVAKWVARPDIVIVIDGGAITSFKKNGVEVAGVAERISACKEAYLNGGTIRAMLDDNTYAMTVSGYKNTYITLSSIDGGIVGGNWDFCDWMRIYIGVGATTVDHYEL